MRVGVGLPSIIPGIPAGLLVEWAGRAESGPFTSLGVLDRIAYDSYDPFVSLAAAAAATSRVGLVTMVVIGPLRPAGTLAKQAASVDALSGGRLTLGVSVGARTSDYEAAGVPVEGRGDRLDEQLADLRVAFADGTVLPEAARRGGPTLLVGGSSGRSFARMARFADGYVHGGGPPRAFAQSGGAGAGGLVRRRPPRRAGAVGAGVLRARRRGAGRGLPARLLRLHRAVRGEDRGRQPHDPAVGHRPVSWLRGGGLRRARAPADRRRSRAARPPRRRARSRRSSAVRIEVIGAGPAGLYFALLAKKADPRHEIVVHERNAPDATFGWGVVFSEETLGSFRDADQPTWAEITETFARWSAIDVHFRGETVRSRGPRLLRDRAETDPRRSSSDGAPRSASSSGSTTRSRAPRCPRPTSSSRPTA